MVKLREIKESDLERIVELCQDREISEMTLNVPYPYTYDHARYFYEHIVLNENIRQYAIYLPDSEVLIGLIGIRFNAIHNWMASIGYWMGKEYRNKGYMTEALKMVIDICFSKYNLVRVYATHNPTNPASGKVMLKAGMEYEGTLKAFIRVGDKYRDSPHYSIINPNFLDL